MYHRIKSLRNMTKGKEAGRIQVYVRVRPFTEKEREKKEINAIALHHDHSLIRVLDPRRETNYFFDGVFGPEASNYELYLKVGRPLVYAALNGYKGTLLTYGQTGTGKTYTLLSEDGVTTNVVDHCFERIHDDKIHSYKVTCSFLQVYQEKVYDLLNPRFTVELPVREHPKKGVYVANLTQNEVKSADDVLALLEFGKRQLVMAETKMVRHSSRSHSIMQLIIERRLKAHIAMEQASTEELGPKSPENFHDSIMAVDETINNLLKELKQDRKTHHRRERECLKELMEKELDDSHSFKGDVIVKGKINLCDLAGSERLTKTKAEGVRLTEAKYLNTSLLELGNVIHALARGKKRHVPYRNSTLTRLLQDCLGDNGKTNFIVCIAPSLSEINETKCSLNFGLRAMRIINVARLNVEVDYKVLAERLAKKLEDQDRRHKLEKLEYLREIQRLNSAVTSYEESEHVVNSDTDTLVSVIQNLSKSVQREKEEKHSLQSELTCLKRKVAHSPTVNAPDIEALFLAELMSMQLLTHVHQSEAVFEAVRQSDLPRKVREYMTSEWTQQNMVLNTGYMLNLLDSALGFSEEQGNGNQGPNTEDPEHTKDSSNLPEKGELQATNKKSTSYVQNMTGGLRKMFGLLVGNKDTKTDSNQEQSIAKHASKNEVSSHKYDQLAADRSKTNSLQVVTTKDMMSKLAHTKEKVERHVSNLLLSAFGEQLIYSQGNSPQWGVLGRKLSELIMFKRNNIIGLKDTEMWSNYENMVGILESCFKYVLIDKALLASMIVIEHMDSCENHHFPRPPSPGRLLKFKALQDVKAIQADKEETSISVSHDSYQVKEVEEKLLASPNKQITIKGPKVHLEQEINEVFDDTSRLETELFATMEEKARLEDELIVMKDYVGKLKSDMFHLKIERANLEKEVRKTAKGIFTLSESGNQQEEQVQSPHNVMEGYRGLRIGELSDVTEASHESISGESENGSQVSECNEQGSQILKNCLSSMAQMYTLTPTPDDDTLTEGGESDDKDASLSEDDIGDSDEDDIIITKIARGIQDYHSPLSSPTKSKKTEALSESRSKQTDHNGKQVTLDAKGKRGNSLKDTVQVQRTHKTFKDLQIAYEDLEDELYHVRGQLSKAQQIIISLEAKLKEEKENWEQIRKLYLEYKDKNDVLEGKVSILREELEKSLRENTFLKDYHQVDVVEDGQNKPYGHHSRSPTRSPSRRKVFDLRNIPSIQNSNRETQIIKLLEENTELRTCNEKLTQEKMLAENHSKEKDSKLKGMEVTLRFLEEEKQTIKEEIETIHRRKFKLGNESQEKSDNSAITSAEIDLFSKETAKLEKELATERNLTAKLQSDNQMLIKDLERMEGELKKWKNGQDEDLTPTNEQVESSKVDKWSGNRNKGLQMVFIDDDFGSEDEGKLNGTDSNDELKDLNLKLQREMLSMSEYQEALEKEYGEVKEESENSKKEIKANEDIIKSLENEITNLKKQIATKQPNEHQGTFFSRLNMRLSPSKPKTQKVEFEFQESKREETGNLDYKMFEEEMNALKRENSELRQQITKSEQKLAIYEADLEKAMFKIKQLQEDRLNRGLQGDLYDNRFASSKLNDTSNDAFKPTAADAEHYLAPTDAKLCKTTKEIERLKEELLDKEAEKGLLYDELHMIRRRKDELDKALDEAREARTELQEKMDQMAKCTHFEDTVKELTEKNQKLVMKMQQSEENVKTLTKKLEKQNDKLKMIEEDLVSASGEKLKGDFELRNVILEMEKAKNELQQSEQDRKLLNTELNEKIEWSTNLEIELMELKCSNECMKKELEQKKEKKRMESHQNQERNIYRETMEKRLHEAFTTNNQLQCEIKLIRDENNELNEKLSNDKAQMEEEIDRLEQKVAQLHTDMEGSSVEKKQFESKTKKLEEAKRKMEEELKRLKDNMSSLQCDLQRFEKQQEESEKKSTNLEKELRRKTKELENKQRENRKLRKEINTTKADRSTENALEIGGDISEVKLLRDRVEQLERENEDLFSRITNQQVSDGNKEKSENNRVKHVTFAQGSTSEMLCNEIGWDFDKDTISEEIDNSNNVNLSSTSNDGITSIKYIKHDLSDEVGWDLSEFSTPQTTMETIKEETSTDGASKIKYPETSDTPSSEIKQSQAQRSEEETAQLNNTEQTSMAKMCKEKLILESKTARLLEHQTSRLTKTQMSLEHSLCKALTENKQLVDKLNDSQLILQRIKSRVQRLEEQTNINVVRIDMETQTIEASQSVSTACQIGEARLSDSDTSPVNEERIKEFGEAVSPTKIEVSASSSKAIVYLTREKKQIAKELEALKQKHGDLSKTFFEKEETRMKLEQELKLITTAYEQEKQSLLHDLDALKADNNGIKDKLKSQEEFLMSCEDIKQKHLEAERLVMELEKDLMRQTDEKNALKADLMHSQNRLNEQKALELELQQLRNENKQTQETMGKQLEQYKRENEELQEKLERRKKTPGSPKKVVHGKKRDSSTTEKKKLVTSLENEEKDIDTSENMSIREQENSQAQLAEPQCREDTVGTADENLPMETLEKRNGEKHIKEIEQSVSNKDDSIEKDENADENEGLHNEVASSDIKTLCASPNDLNKDRDFVDEKAEVKTDHEHELLAIEHEKSTNIKFEMEVPPMKTENLLSKDAGENEDVEAVPKEGVQVEQRNETNDTESTETEAMGTIHTDKSSDIDTQKSSKNINENEENIRGFKETLQEEICSDKGNETEEEADIEEKLVKILQERHVMEQDVQSMVLEMNTLKTKLEKMQDEHDVYSKEQEKQLNELLKEKINMDEQITEMKTKNAKIEIELSDAVETKQAMEEELRTLRETYQNIEQSGKDNVMEVTTKCKKLEDVLSVIVEENSNLFKEVSGLREENRRLKNYNILEIADGSTQVSPNTIDEERNQRKCTYLDMKKEANKTNDETPIINVSSPGFHETSKNPSIKHTIEDNISTKDSVENTFPSKDHLKLPLESSTYKKRYPHQLSIENESKPLSASSPDVSSKVIERVPMSNSSEYLGLESQEYGNVSSTGMLTATTPESESGYGGSKGGNTICGRCHKSACECGSPLRKTSYATCGEIKEVSTKHETSDLVNTEPMYGGDICTDSSFASVTDFEDISFSSDWVSAEDLRAGRVTARGHHGMSKMHREMAEMKCTNTILENELTILKHRNSDYQSQLQKLAGKNNSLKQKLCDRTMVAKKAEREMAAMMEDKMRLEVQVTTTKEEFNRLERERSKLERGLSNAKSENKRLKNDLATIKAESYKNMKQLVKLETENKHLQAELEESREELKRTNELLINVDNGSLTSLDEHQSCASPEPHEGMPLGMVGASFNDKDATNESGLGDRSALSLELRKVKTGYVRRVSSDQSFPRYHNMAKDLATSSESDEISSPEEYHGRHVFAQRLSQSVSQSLATSKDERPTDTLSKTQSDDPEAGRPSASQTSLKHSPNKTSKVSTERTPSQMSYDSDMSFPGDRDAESLQSEETEGSIEQDEKGKSQQGSIKKMFKRFSKSKKISKSSSS